MSPVVRSSIVVVASRSSMVPVVPKSHNSGHFELRDTNVLNDTETKQGMTRHPLSNLMSTTYRKSKRAGTGIFDISPIFSDQIGHFFLFVDVSNISPPPAICSFHSIANQTKQP